MLAAGCAIVSGCTYDFDAPFGAAPYPSADAGGSDASSDAHDASSDAADTSHLSDSAPEPCDTEDKPVGTGIFVSAAGGSDQAAGTSASPVKTLAKALELAALEKVADIYVDEDTYGEVVSIRSATVLHGGWRREGASWTRDCDDDARLRTLVNPASPTVLDATGFSGTAGIEDLTLVTNLAKGDVGESMLALRIAGNGIQFRATNIEVSAAVGGDGAIPVTPADPGAGSCNGHADCSTGLPGNPGPAGAPGKAGVFELSGYVPGDGDDGSAGSSGANGTAGGEGHTATGCESCGAPPACETTSTGELTSGDGTCGCGGKPGVGGPAGNGGGASVGILVAGEGTTLTILSSSVRASDGGNGSAGAIGPGGTGSDGDEGSNPFCGTCIYMAPGCGLSGGWVGGGSPGGPGGKGGEGGKGGGGAGGPSHGIVSVAGANAFIDAATLQGIVVGEGGKGAGGALDGASTPLLEAP